MMTITPTKHRPASTQSVMVGRTELTAQSHTTSDGDLGAAKRRLDTLRGLSIFNGLRIETELLHAADHQFFRVFGLG